MNRGFMNENKTNKYDAMIAWSKTTLILGFWIVLVAGCCYTWDK